MKFKNLRIGDYFMIDNYPEIWRKIEPLKESYNSVCVSGSIAPFTSYPGIQDVRVVSFEQIKDRFDEVTL